MIEDLTISYVSNGIETTLTIKDEYYDNMPYNLADIFAKVIRESDANPQIVIERLKILNKGAAIGGAEFRLEEVKYAFEEE